MKNMTTRGDPCNEGLVHQAGEIPAPRTFEFTLILSGQDDPTDRLASVRYGGRRVDPLLGWMNAEMCLDLGREAISYEGTVISAIRDVEATGLVKVVKVRRIDDEESHECG